MKRKSSKARKFSKQQLLQSSQFSPLQKDVLRVVVADDEHCTIEQANRRLAQFSLRKVL